MESLGRYQGSKGTSSIGLGHLMIISNDSMLRKAIREIVRAITEKDWEYWICRTLVQEVSVSGREKNDSRILSL